MIVEFDAKRLSLSMDIGFIFNKYWSVNGRLMRTSSRPRKIIKFLLLLPLIIVFVFVLVAVIVAVKVDEFGRKKFVREYLTSQKWLVNVQITNGHNNDDDMTYNLIKNEIEA